MSEPMAWLICASLLGSAVLTGALLRATRRLGMLDEPNERSSHSMPTPRGGGLAIVLVTTAALFVLERLGLASAEVVRALSWGGLAIAGVGLWDDRKSVAPVIRLAVQFAAAIWAVRCLGGLPALQIGVKAVPLGWMGDLLAVLGIVWTVNLFNFMDGIDGIAGTEAVFVSTAAAALILLVQGQLCAPALVFAAACAGFLVWNWPPAKIFLGDVGSGYLGFVIVVLAIANTRLAPASAWTWLILGGAFFIDATVTVVRRLKSGQRVHEAHRTHAYQRLARRWASHRKVTLLLLGVNVFWLLPWALLAAVRPTTAMIALGAALSPLALGAWMLGAGLDERAPREPVSGASVV